MKKFLVISLMFLGLLACSDDDVPTKSKIYVPPTEEEDSSTTDIVAEHSGFYVDGKYLKDSEGNVVNLHGFAQTYSPWFNEQGTKWTNYDVSGCLKYNQGLIKTMITNGWKVDWIRLHMDPYWSNTPGQSTTGESDISAYSKERFVKYLDEVFVPMAEYAISYGLAVVMRPPGVCPQQIKVGDDYQNYLIEIWDIVSKHASLKNNPHIMFELANEPIYMYSDKIGDYGPRWDNSKGWVTGDDFYVQETEFFQKIVDVIRANGCNNVLWVPGLAYQGDYQGYAKYPINSTNIGYAVHCYPGWFGSDGENGDGGTGTGCYDDFKSQFEQKVGCVAKTNPIIVTELDWARKEFAREGYLGSWGTGYTGVAGENGFGANFKKIADDMGNVSWLTFITPNHLAEFDPTHAEDGGADGTGLYDWESGVYPVYQWFSEYASE